MSALARSFVLTRACDTACLRDHVCMQLWETCPVDGGKEIFRLRTNLYSESNCLRVYKWGNVGLSDENRRRTFWSPLYWFILYGMMWSTSESIICMKIPYSTIAMLLFVFPQRMSAVTVSVIFSHLWLYFVQLYPGTHIYIHTHFYMYKYTQH
jgi:hypothetical protein